MSTDIKTFGVGLHQPICDVIMDHFDEMSSTGRATDHQAVATFNAPYPTACADIYYPLW